MAIQSKNKSTIKAKEYSAYNPETFHELVRPNFIECDAQYVLDNLKPFEPAGLPGHKIISVDTETYSYATLPANRIPEHVVRRYIKGGSNKDIPNDFPFCISMCDGINSFVVYDTIENKFAEFKKLAPILSDRSIDKVLHNVGFDMHMIANTGVDVKGQLHDTVILSKLTRADAFTHRLFDIAKYMPNGVTIFESMLDTFKSQYRITDYRMFPRDLMTQYTCADVWNAIWYFIDNIGKIKEMELEPLYKIENEMLMVAFYMERVGIAIDADYEDILIPELQKEVEDAEREIYDTAGTIFNINSSAQIYSVLCKLGYGDLVRFSEPTATMLSKGIVKGNPKLDKIEMERLDNAGVPIISQITQFRKSEKLLNTFAKKLYTMCDFNHVVHCNFNTIEAKTGRFSISSPSMQNMPRRGDSRVRGAFIPKPDYTLYDFDFKSQESIILVHYSKSGYLMDILKKGGDIHKAFASIIYSIPYEEVTKELRGIAKSVEFAIVYGAGASKVAAMTGLTLGEAQVAMKTILKNAPEISTFINTANKKIRQTGYIRTIMHRPVYAERGREYASVNYLCQGSAADSTKSRMIDIHKFIYSNHYKTRIILQVHDSLLQMVHKDEEHLLGKLKWLQTERNLFRVTVQVDVAKCSPTWRDKEDIDIESVRPSDEEMANMDNFDIWNMGLFVK